jgi:[acyl-carrier-protein] S-malonyltransferase
MTSLSPGSIILCPGQGAQAVGMGKAWCDASDAARAVFAAADRQLGDRLGAPLSKLCFEGPADTLNKTDASKPAIYTTSVACWRALLAMTPERNVAATAGLSLGEYTALHVAGAISFEDGLELVTLRGRAMQDAADSPEAKAGGGGGMIALIGGTDEQAEQIAREARGSQVLVAANYNAPGQVVLSGHKQACERAAKVAEAMGVKSSILQVAGAFHSPLMAAAAERLRQALEKTPLQAPRCTVVSNVTAQPHTSDSAAIRQRLVEQLTMPVRWAQSCAWLAGQTTGVAGGAGAGGFSYVELAPGRTLMGLFRRIDKSIKVDSNDTPPVAPLPAPTTAP